VIGRIAKIVKVLNSETEPSQIALALCFAMIVGLTPLFSLHNLLILLLVLVLRVNLSTFILGWIFFSGVAYLLDPLFHRIGLALLGAGSLENVWTAFYNTTLLRLAHFNNTIVMGSLVVALILFGPLYVTADRLIRKYREHFLSWFRKTKLMNALQATRIYDAYQRLSDWGGLK
jgi:uncharacterized protein (TIGR03546 family)